MSIDPVSVVNAVKAIAPFVQRAAPLVIPWVQKREAVIKILKQLNLDPTKPPIDVDGAYTYALVEYGVYKPEPILQLFRENAIKKAFWIAYTIDNPLDFLTEIEKFLQGKPLREEIIQARLDLRAEAEEFGEAFIEIAKRSRSIELQPYPSWDLEVYPTQFKALIQDKTRIFCGRVFVFQELQKFIEQNKKGYFTVTGDAGMGKTAIVAKYVSARKCPCFFNIRSSGINRPELFLDSIREQLIKRYNLQNATGDNLATLLGKVSKKLAPDEKLIIVVDALDEVEQEKRNNLLDLPDSLPDRLYFFLTRRPYTPDTKQFTLSPDTPTKELDLRTDVTHNRQDITQYIEYYLRDSEQRQALTQWISDRQISAPTFIEKVADKSENNFMYLRYVLPAIASGFYNDLNLQQLPDGLQNYYQDHWQRMGMNDRPQENKVIILFILVAISTPITVEILAAIADRDEYEVGEILQEWVEYTSARQIDGESCYSIYHTSFLEFLQRKSILNEKRPLFTEVRAKVAEFLSRGDQP